MDEIFMNNIKWITWNNFSIHLWLKYYRIGQIDRVIKYIGTYIEENSDYNFSI